MRRSQSFPNTCQNDEDRPDDAGQPAAKDVGARNDDEIGVT